MDRNEIKQEETGFQVLSVRLSNREFKHLQETLRNLDIRRESLSASVRALLKQDLFRSRRLRRKAAKLKRRT